MTRKKVFTTLILCFLIGNNVCEGFPSPSKLKDHSSFITATPTFDGDYLSRFVSRGTKTESTRGRYKLTTLPLEETTDSSDSVFESGHETEATEDDERNVSEASQKRFPVTRGSRRNLKLADQRDSFTEKRSFRDEPNLRHSVTLTGQKEFPDEEKSLHARGKTRSHHKLRLMSQRKSSKHVHSPTAKRQEKTHSSPALFNGESHMSETTTDHRNKEQRITKGQQTLSPTETTHETDRNAESVDDGNVTSEGVSGDRSDERWKLKATPQGSSMRFSTSVPQETTKSPGSRQEAGREEGSGEHRTTEGSFGGRRGRWKKLRVTSPSRYRSTVPPPSLEVTLNSAASSREIDHNAGSYGVGNVEATDEPSSRGRPRMSTKKATSRKLSTAIPWGDIFKPTDSISSVETDKNSETHGKGSNGESETAQKGVSENASAVMQQGNQLDTAGSLNATEPHSSNVAGNDNAEDGFQAKGSSREGSSIPFLTTMPQEDNFHPNTSTIKTSQSMGKSDNDDEGYSQGSSGGGPDERWSNGRLNVTIHKGIVAEHGTPAIQQINTTVRPEMQNTSVGIRWTVPFQPGRLLEGKSSKQKKKEANEDQDVSPSSAASIVAGLLAVAIVLLVIGTFLWRNCKSRFLRRSDPELGLVTPSMTNLGEELSDEEIIFERKPKGCKNNSLNAEYRGTPPSEQAQKSNFSTHAPTTWTISNEPRSTTLMTTSADTDTPRLAEFWTEDETSENKGLLSPSGRSDVSSELSQMPKETPSPVTPKSLSISSVATDMEMRKCSHDFLTPPVQTSSCSLLQSQLKDGSTSAEQSSTPADSPSCPDVPKELTRTLSNEIGVTSPSTGSSKKPVSPVTDVVLTIPDEAESKAVQGTGKEFLCEDMTYHTGNPNTEAKPGDVTDNEGGGIMETRANDNGPEEESFTGAPPTPPPPMKPLSVTTELRRGRSLIGGQKALGNRLYIKHLTSGEHSSGFQGDLEKAAFKIMTDNGHSIKKNKGKRKVIKEQTKGTGKSIKESIVSAKSIIMSEEVDTVRDKKSASRRHVIHKAQAPRVDANLRRRSSLRKEIAFAQSVILPDANQQKAKQRTKERVKVIVEMVNELKNPTFQERIKIAAQTINPDERIRDLNAKSSYKRNVIKMDAEMLQARKKTSAFAMDIKFVRNVICGRSTTDHEDDPQMGCLCYYCKRHWQKTGGPPCFSLPRKIVITKDIVLIDGVVFFMKPNISTAPFSAPSVANDPASVPVTSNGTG